MTKADAKSRQVHKNHCFPLLITYFDFIRVHDSVTMFSILEDGVREIRIVKVSHFCHLQMKSIKVYSCYLRLFINLLIFDDMHES